MILDYKEIWRDNLDPMGIILNRLENGVEIDFFMTPLPHFSSKRELAEIVDIAK